MSYELKQKAFSRRNYRQSYESARSSLKAILSPLDFCHVCSTIEAKASKSKDRISFKLDKKFNNLKRKYGIPQLSNLNDDDIIFNYSHRVLTEAEKMFWQEDYVSVCRRRRSIHMMSNVLLNYFSAILVDLGPL